MPGSRLRGVDVFAGQRAGVLNERGWPLRRQRRLRGLLRPAQARADLSHDPSNTLYRKSGCVRIHLAAPQPKDAAKDRQAGFEVSTLLQPSVISG